MVSRGPRRPRIPVRDWYVWATKPPENDGPNVFPGVERGVWTRDEASGHWYRHRFYSFEPDLNTGNERVRAEIRKIAAYWLRLGVSGFRIDAASFLIETSPGGRRDYAFLGELRETLSWRRGDAVLLAEANVADDELLDYFGCSDDFASRVLMVFAFRINEALLLSLARKEARPIQEVLRKLPDLPGNAQWATFLRNHDECDLGRLSPDEREDVFAEFGPNPDMQLYGRGVRRRLVPMLGGDRARVELAYSLQLTMPGTPVIRYGDEIGMGENLGLPEREAVRTRDSRLRPGSRPGPQGKRRARQHAVPAQPGRAAVPGLGVATARCGARDEHRV